MNAYQLDRKYTRAFLIWAKTAPFTAEETAARAEMDRCRDACDEYAARWIAAHPAQAEAQQ